MTIALRHSSHFLAASLIALSLATAARAADYKIENVTIQPPNKKGVATIKLIDVKGANISKEEFARIYDLSASKDDVLGIVKKLKADSIDVPEISITNKDKGSGTMTVRGYRIVKIDQGKFGKFSIAGFDGKFTNEENGPEATVKGGALGVEDGDISKLFDAALGGKLENATSKFGKFDFRDFEVRFPEKTKAGPLFHTIKVGSVSGETKYQGELPTTGSAEIKGVLFVPAGNSEAQQALSKFGYKQVEAGLKFAGAYNPSTKAYDMTDFTINGVNAGALTLKGLFGNIGPEAFNGAQMARIGALMAGDVDNVSLRYADSGLFDKALVFYAGMVGKDPMAVRQEWAGMVAGILPMMMGGNPDAGKLAMAVSDFIKAPKSLLISVKGKGGPVRFSDLAQMRDPMALLQKVEFQAVANR